MPILIVMNKPYNDDEALRTVVNYVKRVGYGFYGGYAVNPRYASEEIGLIKRVVQPHKSVEIIYCRCIFSIYQILPSSIEELVYIILSAHLQRAGKQYEKYDYPF